MAPEAICRKKNFSSRLFTGNRIGGNAFHPSWGRVGCVMRRTEYRERATECLQLANETTDPRHRARLLDMASAWMRLHDQAERNAQADLAYETPRSPPVMSQVHQQQQQRAKDEG